MERFPALERLAGIVNTRNIQHILRFHRAAVLSTVGIAVLLPVAIQDYRAYLSYGPGGLPHNAFGWLVATMLRVFSREQLSPKPYSNKELPFADEPGYLPADFPPKRLSPRPKIGSHPVPQRQLEQLPADDLRQKLIDRFTQLGQEAEKQGLVEVKQSFYERRHKGLFVSSTRPEHAVLQQTHGEISHVHAGLDGSIHVTLHPADCKKVIESGWGQRHAFSGVNMGPIPITIPVTYLLIYSPRDEAEIEVAISIVKAGIQFMTRTRESVYG